jgi:hypothetical protein
VLVVPYGALCNLRIGKSFSKNVMQWLENAVDYLRLLALVPSGKVGVPNSRIRTSSSEFEITLGDLPDETKNSLMCCSRDVARHAHQSECSE